MSQNNSKNFIFLSFLFLILLINCFTSHSAKLKTFSALSARALKKAPPYPGKILSDSEARHHNKTQVMRSFGAGPSSREFSSINAKGSLKVIAVRCQFVEENNNALITGNGRMVETKEKINEHFTKFANYYKKASYGNLELKVDISDKIYEAAQKMSYYGGSNESQDRVKSLVNDIFAVSELNPSAGRSDISNYIDYTKYNVIALVHAGYGQESDVAGGGSGNTSDDIWSIGFTDLGLNLTNSNKLNYAIVVPESEAQDGNIQNSPLGVICHEFGHILGLPDLYDTDNSSFGAGAWDLMGYGAWRNSGNDPCMLSSWSLISLGYLTAKEIIVDSPSIEVKALCDSPDALKLYASDKASNPGEYFLIENRAKKGLDSYIEGGGILIWHIDDGVGAIGLNNINVNEKHKRVDLESAEGYDSTGFDRFDYNKTGALLMSDKDPFYSGYKSLFNAYSNPSSMPYNANNAAVSVEVLSSPGDTMNVRASFYSIGSPGKSEISKAYFYPNPASGSEGKFYYYLNSIPDEVTLKIFDRSRKTLLRKELFGKAGINEYIWNLTGDDYRQVPNGTYFYKITARTVSGESEKTGKICILK